METLASVSILFYVVLSLNVGLRLMRLSLDARRLDAGVVGSAMLVSIAATATLAIGVLLPGRAGETVTALGFLLLVAVGVFPFIILWKVFRPRSHSMSWVVAASLFALGTAYLADMAGPGFELSPDQLIPLGSFKWIFIASGIVSSVWQSTEALYRSLTLSHAERRQPHELYDQPRYALWAVGTGALSVLYILVLAQYLGALPQAVVYLVVPLCTALHASCLQLIYFPPRILRSWVRA